MAAPITEHACYYYRTTAWEWKRRGRSSEWVKVAAECMHLPFFLDDNTGKVMVDPRGADLDLHRDFKQEFCDSFFTTKQEAPPNVHSFLARHGVSTTNKIKVEEFCIKPKNALFVLGTLDENPGLELASKPIQDTESTRLSVGDTFSLSIASTVSSLTGRADTPDPSAMEVPLGEQLIGDQTLRQLGYDKSNLYRKGFDRSAHPASSEVIHLSPDSAPAKAADMTQQQKVAAALLKAGISNPAAWAAAGVNQSQIVVKHDANGNLSNGSVEVLPQSAAPIDGFDPHPAVVLMKGKNNPTFMISWRSQRELARSLGWKCTLMIWGGPALALLCLYGLHILTHWF